MQSGSSLVLITGATSAPGRRLIEALLRGLPGHPTLATPQAGLRIRCLVMPAEEFQPLRALSDRVQILVGDLRHPQNAARLCHEARGAVLFHLALARDRSWLRGLNQVNLAGTKLLLDAAIPAGVRRVVALSDSSVCSPDRPSGGALDETEAPKPSTPAGRSLLDREQCLRAREKELESIIIRSAPVYGPRPDGRLPLWASLALAGKWPPAGAPQRSLSLTGLDNLVEALLLAAAAPKITSQTLWVSDPAPLDPAALAQSLRSLADDEIAHGGGKELAQGGPLPPKVLVLGGRLLGLLGLGCARGDEARALSEELVVSTRRLQAELGWRGAGKLEDELRRMLRAAASASVRNRAKPKAPAK